MTSGKKTLLAPVLVCDEVGLALSRNKKIYEFKTEIQPIKIFFYLISIFQHLTSDFVSHKLFFSPLILLTYCISNSMAVSFLQLDGI